MNVKISILVLLFTLSNAMAQEKEKTAPPLKQKPALQFNLNESGEHYIRLAGLLQVWARHTEMNPGTTVNGVETKTENDLGLRRLRFHLFGQITDEIFFYAQFGQNNFTSRSPKYVGAFFHDALAEIKIFKSFVSLGGGLTAWSGLSRYASPSVGSIMSLDVPLYQQATNSINDQFLRKLSIYAKGQIGPLDYRLALTDPLDITVIPAGSNSIDVNEAKFSPESSSFQYQGYLKFQFFEKESNSMPYHVGTYLGQKKVLALGLGFITQPDAMWKLNSTNDTLHQSMTLLGIDVFFDLPLNESKTLALTIYGAYSNYQMGENYLRMVGVMNPGNGTNVNQTINGGGNAFPMIGTGQNIYAQAGLMFGENILLKGGKLQPYVASQISNFEALDDPMMMAEVGINWYLHGTHGSKLTLNYQSRPLFEISSIGEKKVTKYAGMAQFQIQVAF